ncbi:MAG TPA: protein-L-isoaspartate(D-aspartate) O-methyltransferase [Anaerolineae bacterium]
MTPDQERFAIERARMVERQLKARGIRDPAILEAMSIVPREHFVPASYRKYAYRDGPIPIPNRQTISQPYVVALMISALHLQPTDRVLEIGTGSGYAAAVLSRIVQAVYTVERHARLVQYARERLADLGYDNVWVHHGDGTLGWPEHAPYTAIIVAAGGPDVPPSLAGQLEIGGRLVMPVGRHRRQQKLVRITRQGPDEFTKKDLGAVAFVPLVGEEGWH